MLLFLYGTLLDRRVLTRQAGDRHLAQRLVPAMLHDHSRVHLRGTPYPTLLPRQADTVAGAVMRPSPAALRRLQIYEGPSYRLTPIRVVTARGPKRAHAWIAPRWRADPGRRWSSPD